MSNPEPNLAETPSVSIRKRLLIASGVVVFWAAVLVLVPHLLEGHRGQSALQETLARLDEREPGWRLADLEAARATVPEATNSAPTILAAHRLFSIDVLERAMTPFQTMPPLPELLDADRAALLERELTPFTAAVVEARKLAEMPTGRHLIIMADNPFNTSLDHVGSWRLRRRAPVRRRAKSGAEG